MRLIRCYIENFGTLSRFSHEFSEGLNIVCEENGWGKSTLAVFIKAMFYGLPATTKKTLDDNERKKYSPWSGGKFGGNLEFERSGKKYRIERYFGERESADTFRLFDLLTNRETREYSSDIGREIFRLDADAYERSTYLPQKHMDWAINDSIKTKLTNLIDDTDDINNYKRALERIDKKRIFYEKQGGDRGRVAVLTESGERLRQRLAEAERDIKIFAEKEIAIKETEREIVKAEEGYAHMKTELASMGRHADIRAEHRLLKSAAEKDAEEEGALKEFFAAGVPENETLEKMNARLVEHAAIRQGANKIVGSDEGSTRLLKTPLLQGVGAILLFFGLILWLTDLSVLGGMIFVAAGGVVWLIAAVLFIKTKRTQSMYKQMDGIKNEISEFLNKYVIADDISAFASALSLVAQKKEALEAALERGKKSAAALTAFESDYDVNDCAEIIDALPEKMREAEELIHEFRRKKALLNNDLEVLAVSFSAKEEIEALIKSEAEELAAAKRTLKALKTAYEYLGKAHDNLSVKYIGVMQKSFAAFAENFGGMFAGFSIDPDLQIKIEKAGEAKEMAAFSAGLKNLVNIGLRLSLTDALFEGEKPFIILDDPFINLSDLNLKKMKIILEKLAERYQIIHFICHTARR